MFFRQKKSGGRVYLQIVENRWEHGGSRQRVIATLGRLDRLRETGQLDALLESGARFSESVMVLAAHREGEVPAIRTWRIGPALVFERLWEELQFPQVIAHLLGGRRFRFPVERALFLMVLHRLLASGSDRSCILVWRKHYQVRGVGSLELHQMYRSMGWLGEPLAEEEQAGATPFAPRCTKDRFEESLFERRRDLFSELDLVFFDTTSIYFEGEGRAELGAYGNSKDHRPDRKQMVVGVVLDGEGRPLCCELWPGNVTDVKTLIPVVDRLRKRFRIRSICIVADRGMISKATIAQLQAKEWDVRFILGARMRKVKEVRVDDRRYVVCLNEDEARKDKADREAIVEALRQQLKQGAKSLVGNKGYRKYLRCCEYQGKRFLLRSEAQGTCGRVFRAVGVALPPTVQQITQ